MRLDVGPVRAAIGVGKEALERGCEAGAQRAKAHAGSMPTQPPRWKDGASIVAIPATNAKRISRTTWVQYGRAL